MVTETKVIRTNGLFKKVAVTVTTAVIIGFGGALLTLWKYSVTEAQVENRIDNYGSYHGDKPLIFKSMDEVEKMTDTVDAIKLEQAGIKKDVEYIRKEQKTIDTKIDELLRRSQ